MQKFTNKSYKIHCCATIAHFVFIIAEGEIVISLISEKILSAPSVKVNVPPDIVILPSDSGV